MLATLALDFGASMGWALERHDGRLESGCKALEGRRIGEKFYRLRLWLHDTKRRVGLMGGELGRVIYERVDFMKPGQVYAAHAWGGYEATVTAWCEHHGIEYQNVAVASLKKLATGNGFSPKPHVRAAVNKRLQAITPPQCKRVVDLNEADALALLLFAAPAAREAAA